VLEFEIAAHDTTMQVAVLDEETVKKHDMIG